MKEHLLSSIISPVADDIGTSAQAEMPDLQEAVFPTRRRNPVEVPAREALDSALTIYRELIEAALEHKDESLRELSGRINEIFLLSELNDYERTPSFCTTGRQIPLIP